MSGEIMPDTGLRNKAVGYMMSRVEAILSVSGEGNGFGGGFGCRLEGAYIYIYIVCYCVYPKDGCQSVVGCARQS